MNHAIINAQGVVENITVSKIAIEDNWFEIPKNQIVNIGDSFSGGIFTAAPIPALTAQEKIDRVIDLMKEKQDGGIVFYGLPVATDNSAKGDLAGAKLKPKTKRKIVTRQGKGAKSEFSSVQVDALFDAVENYRQAVMDRAYDLLEAIEADPGTDIDTGWPSNEFT